MVFERRERMLDDGSSELHDLRRGSLLHALQCAFVQVTLYVPSRGSGAARFQRTLEADLGFGCVKHTLLLGQSLLTRECLLGRAAEGVGLFVVLKLAAVKQCAIAMTVDRTIGRHVGQDALGFTELGLLAVGITG